MSRLIIIISLFVLLISCEKNIDFVPDDSTPAVVVDASIENFRAPLVRLSRSLRFFSKLTPELLAASFIHGATVQISNGEKTVELIEDSIELSTGQKIYHYSIDTAGPDAAFKGKFGKKYTLKITVDGKEYNAVTTIPPLTKRIDSLWYMKAPGTDDPTKMAVMARFTDPPGFGNYIRYYTQVNNGLFNPPNNSVFDDQIVDGKIYDLLLESGTNRASNTNLEDYVYFYRGETITVKLCNIDKATFDFWRTMEFNYASIGNPFSSPGKVLGNIKGGALGYFGGYAVQYSTIVIP